MPITEDVPPAISDHPAHPGHKLKLKMVANDDSHFFMCGGCKESGSGTRYSCQHKRCSFHLHTCCAVTPATLTRPVFGSDRVFLFLLETEPPGTKGGKGSGGVCVACGKEARGFVYHCFDDDDGLDLHPCCARRPELQPTLDTHHDGNQHSRGIRRVPAARHRGWPGLQLGRQRDPPPENVELNTRASELRQQHSRPGDTSDDRNRGRERRAPFARHRSWTR